MSHGWQFEEPWRGEWGWVSVCVCPSMTALTWPPLTFALILQHRTAPPTSFCDLHSLLLHRGANISPPFPCLPARPPEPSQQLLVNQEALLQNLLYYLHLEFNSLLVFLISFLFFKRLHAGYRRESLTLHSLHPSLHSHFLLRTEAAAREN